MYTLADAATMATLILFVIYFIGRIITVRMEKNMFYDEIVFTSSDCIENKRYDIIDEISTENLNNESSEYETIVIITSRQGIRNLKIEKMFYDDELNEIKSKRETVGECKFLNIGQSFAIRTFIPELIPRYRIEYETQDFRKVSFELLDNFKSGIISETVVVKHTLKSIIYYLFR